MAPLLTWLKLIEHVWSWMKNYTQERYFEMRWDVANMPFDRLRALIWEEWEAVPNDFIEILINSWWIDVGPLLKVRAVLPDINNQIFTDLIGQITPDTPFFLLADPSTWPPPATPCKKPMVSRYDRAGRVVHPSYISTNQSTLTPKATW